MGVSQIIGAIVAIMIVMVIGISVINYTNNNVQNQSIIYLAQQTADVDTQFQNALSVYANSGHYITGQITCATLQSAGYLASSFTCNDPLGETLAGYISAPWGFPQTYFTTVSSSPNISILDKYGLNNPLKWKAFIYQLAIDDTNSSNSGMVLSSSNDFTEPNTQNTDSLSDYFPSSSVYYPQTMPDIPTYDNYQLIDGTFQKTPGYWVWQIQEFLGTSSASASISNLGYSASCSLGGITPVAAPSK